MTFTSLECKERKDVRERSTGVTKIPRVIREIRVVRYRCITSRSGVL